jgi:hypothetical protein
MTLETAKKIVDEGFHNKEAEAVVRGGMTVCETKTDGSRVYQWIKVLPTEVDGESSIDVALEKHRNRKQKWFHKKKEEQFPLGTEPSPMPVLYSYKENRAQTSHPSLLERIKKEAKDFWKELDRIVIE